MMMSALLKSESGSETSVDTFEQTIVDRGKVFTLEIFVEVHQTEWRKREGGTFLNREKGKGR